MAMRPRRSSSPPQDKAPDWLADPHRFASQWPGLMDPFHQSARPVRLVGWPQVALLVTTGTAITLSLGGMLEETGAIIALLSAALLVIGMPHGSFDIALLQHRGPPGASSPSRVLLIALYLACAMAMYALWRVAPAWGLSVFLLMAGVHFAEDWRNCGSGFIALGIAVALLSAPALLHTASLRGYFAILSNDAAARNLVDLLLLIAPAMLALAAVGVAMLWRAREHRLAIAAGCGVTAMLVLPPRARLCAVLLPRALPDPVRRSCACAGAARPSSMGRNRDPADTWRSGHGGGHFYAEQGRGDHAGCVCRKLCGAVRAHSPAHAGACDGAAQRQMGLGAEAVLTLALRLAWPWMIAARLPSMHCASASTFCATSRPIGVRS